MEMKHTSKLPSKVLIINDMQKRNVSLILQIGFSQKCLRKRHALICNWSESDTDLLR